jgi:septin family protein
LNSVAILGPENKGKSTVLNALFGTNFKLYEQYQADLQQPANGIDVAVSEQLVIFDVRGFDSSNRQEAMPSNEAVNIEDGLALFVLLESDVVIINLMVNDCGTYSASGMKTLETIFKAALQLPEAQRLRTKKQILFFVRDVAKQSIEAIRSTLMTRVEEVYARAGLSESEIRGMIDVEVVTFPHYEYCREAFDAKVQEVRALFEKQGIFSQHPGVSCDLIPAKYQASWNAVMASESLNLHDMASVIHCFHQKEQQIYEMHQEAERQRQRAEEMERAWQREEETERQRTTEIQEQFARENEELERPSRCELL